MNRRLRNVLIVVAVVAALAEIAFLMPSDVGRKPHEHTDPPMIILHRAGSADWIQNTLGAVRGALERGATGIELDVVLTGDGVPVIAHDPWVHETLCRRADGSAIEGRVLIKDHAAADLRRDFVCGGVPDPDFPDAALTPGPMPTLDEVLEALTGHPEVTLFLDVKIDPPLTRDATAYAEAIFGRLKAAAPKNPLLVEGPDPESIAAYRAAAGDVAFTPLISTPAFRAEQNHIAVAIAARARTRMFRSAAVKRAREAGAEGIVSPIQTVHRTTAVRALDAGQQVVVFGPETREALSRFCNWPVTAIIIDDIDLGTCADAARP